MGDEAVVTEEYKGHTINIFQDADPISPREDDNLGAMICFHKRYDLGDKHNWENNSVGLIHAREFIDRKDVLFLPLYLYDHSGITIATTPFECPWDSGQVGWVAITLAKVRAEFSVKRVTKKLKETVFGILESEVKAYDD